MNEQTKPVVKGLVTQVIGPVVDFRFDVGELPPLYGAIILTNPAIDERKDNLVLEVAKHIGDNLVRCIAMDTTDGLVRGMEGTYRGEQITMPVGPEILGRILNVIGDPVDELGPVLTEKRYPIHRPAPSLMEQSTKVERFETGIRVIDLLAPYSRGGKIGLFEIGRASCRERVYGCV